MYIVRHKDMKQSKTTKKLFNIMPRRNHEFSHGVSFCVFCETVPDIVYASNGLNCYQMLVAAGRTIRFMLNYSLKSLSNTN